MPETDQLGPASWTSKHRNSAKRWRIDFDDIGFAVLGPGLDHTFTGDQLGALDVRVGLFGSKLQVAAPMGQVRVGGLRRGDARAIEATLAAAHSRHRVSGFLRQAIAWHSTVLKAIENGLDAGVWIPEEAIAQLERTRPRTPDELSGKGHAIPVEHLTAEQSSAVSAVRADLRAWLAGTNEAIIQNELRDQRTFFNTIEKSPLTEEQARAVICFDNRVQVIAAAGSGKTSLMVARTAYAIQKQLIAPERILLLAFNAAAAEELGERVRTRLHAARIDPTGVRANTFHSFGRSLVGQAGGRMPGLAPWVAPDRPGGDVDKVHAIIRQLAAGSAEYQFRLDVFRLLYGGVTEQPAGGEPDDHDKVNKRLGFRTLGGDVVRSEGERIIADFLYANHVPYEYERRYEHDVADPEHAQYRPDFFYPEINVWHEHWAIGYDGQPPPEFRGYAQSMEWKRQTHRQYGTDLIETTWAEIMGIEGLQRFAGELAGRGVKLRWDPDRKNAKQRVMTTTDLAKLMRTFMAHVKSNSLTPETLRRRMRGGPDWFQSPRIALFLDLYWPVHERWNEELARADAIDFEDMLTRAAEALENGDVESEYDLVLVDEFQDASHARARLARGLVNGQGRYLLTVGDDWQAINRFAGADIAVMTEFEIWFGRGHTHRLQTTFRCTQAICDSTSSFITKNPRQLRKQVRSAQRDHGPTPRLIRVATDDDASPAISGYLGEITERHNNEIGRGERISVFVLGRYGFVKDIVPRTVPDGINLVFRTAHGSKGLEADYVIIPNMNRGVYGFPSEITDDPVLDVVMAHPDAFPSGEERRLFYVALTRAKREVVLIATRGRESAFVAEMLEDRTLIDLDEPTNTVHTRCPHCEKGLVVTKTGPYGEFLACNRYPRCDYKPRYGG